MKTKEGISLIALTITIIVMTLLTGVIIIQTEDVIGETKKEQFIVEISTIETKVKEYYLSMGSLPVNSNEQYDLNSLLQKLDNVNNRQLLQDEITINNDTDNKFLIIDLDLMKIQSGEIGRETNTTDIFVIATNSLNVYYLKGQKIDGVIRFSLANLVDKNLVTQNKDVIDTTVELKNELDIIKSTNVWTNNISVIIKNELSEDEVWNYSVGGANSKAVPKSKTIVINETTLTDDEKQALYNNKEIIISRLKGNDVVEIKKISLENLDMIKPEIKEITAASSENEKYNKITIMCSDDGGSKVKAIYYDYLSVTVNGQEQPYYSDRSSTTASDLISFGKISSDRVINLDKNIKTIVAVVKDNAGNMSEMMTYNIEIEN